MTFLPQKTADQLQQQTQRLCYHLVLLRVQDLQGVWTKQHECADCQIRFYAADSPEERVQ